MENILSILFVEKHWIVVNKGSQMGHLLFNGSSIVNNTKNGLLNYDTAYFFMKNLSKLKIL